MLKITVRPKNLNFQAKATPIRVSNPIEIIISSLELYYLTKIFLKMKLCKGRGKIRVAKHAFRKMQNLSNSGKVFTQNIVITCSWTEKIWKWIFYPNWRKNNFESQFFLHFFVENDNWTSVGSVRGTTIAGQTVIIRALSTPDQ